MKKSDVIHHFGGNQSEVARVVGVTSAAVHRWPEVLTSAIKHRLIGAMYCKGRKVPVSWKKG